LPSASASGPICVLGLAYKPETNVIEESPAVRIIDELLAKEDAEVIVYDPLAMDNARAHFGDKILYASSVKDCLASASVCIITTPSEEFRVIDDSFIVNDPTVIIDCWRMLDAKKLGSKAKHICLGKCGNWQSVEI